MTFVKAPSYVNATLLCRVSKKNWVNLMRSQLNYLTLVLTQLVLLNFDQKKVCQSTIICQLNISLSRCQNSSYSLQRDFSLSCRHLSKRHHMSKWHFFVLLPSYYFPRISRTFGLSIKRYWFQVSESVTTKTRVLLSHN